MIDSLSQRLVPEELWALVESLIPPMKVCLHGGGRSRTDPRAVFTAIVFALTSGCVDRGKPGSKIHAISDRVGLPLAVAVSAANADDSEVLKPLVNTPYPPSVRVVAHDRRGNIPL